MRFGDLIILLVHLKHHDSLRVCCVLSVIQLVVVAADEMQSDHLLGVTDHLSTWGVERHGYDAVIELKYEEEALV